MPFIYTEYVKHCLKKTVYMYLMVVIFFSQLRNHTGRVPSPPV
jgi:hypothetical protein